jgi:hypothetical protein
MEDDRNERTASATSTLATGRNWIILLAPSPTPYLDVSLGQVLHFSPAGHFETGTGDTVFLADRLAQTFIGIGRLVDPAPSSPESSPQHYEEGELRFQVDVLFSPTIPFGVVANQKLIEPYLLLTASSTTNMLELSTDAAARLREFAIDQTRKPTPLPPNYLKEEPPPGVFNSGLRGMLSKIGVAHADGYAFWILRRAASLVTSEQTTPQITTSRLALAALAVAREDGPPGRGPMWPALRSMFSEKINKAIDRLSNEYREYVWPDEAVPSITSNVDALIRIACRISQDAFDADQNTLAGEGLYAAILTMSGTGAEKRFQGAALSLVELRQSFVDALAQLGYPAKGWDHVFTELQPPPTVDVATLGNDDPWDSNISDQLGVSDEARAFARIATASSFDPPLAIGVFGPWGSGKTFFLRLMYEHIEALSNKRAPESSDLFIRDVVQIRFNAWHYVDTNLWASLVDHIFSELDRWVCRKEPKNAQKLFEHLSTARELTLEATEQLISQRKEQKASADRLAVAERELVSAQAGMGLTPRTFWNAVQHTFRSQIGEDEKLLIAAAQQLGITQIESDAKALNSTLELLADEGRRSKLVWTGMVRQCGAWPTLVAILVCLAIPVFLVVFRQWLVGWMHGVWGANFASIVLTFAGIVGPLIVILGRAARTALDAVSTIERFRANLNDAIAKERQNPSQNVRDAEKKLAELNAEVEEARAALAISSTRLAEATREFNAGTGRGRLFKFVRERVASGQYSKHLGIIATIRRDFEELAINLKDATAGDYAEAESRREAHRVRIENVLASDGNLLTDGERGLLEGAISDPVDPELQTFSRIILYIDDLDRCSPQHVVDVLQAVHLLLTFPLFVVVVAVDVRWVRRALESHYRELLEDSNHPRRRNGDTEHPPNDMVTANDYLEKIFQIPYWVRPMDAKSSRALLAARASTTTAGSLVKNSSSPFKSPAPAVHGDASASVNGLPEQQVAPLTVEIPPANPAGSKSDRNITSTVVRALSLSPADSRYMDQLGPYVVNSPRQAIRFLNVYRIIKASFGPRELEDLIERSGFASLMTLLAMAMSAPDAFGDWVTMIEEAKDWEDLRESWSKRAVGDLRSRQRISKIFEIFIGSDPESPNTGRSLTPPGLALLRRYAPLARRYSFTG